MTAVVAPAELADPWQDLDPARSPAQADRHAQELLGATAPDDPRRVAGLVSWLVQRAGLDGSTVVPVDLVSAALRAYDVADPAAGADLAMREGRVAAFAEDRMLGHPVESLAEERAADALVDLVAQGTVAAGTDIAAADLAGRVSASRLTVALAPRGDTRLGLVRMIESAAEAQLVRVATCAGVDAAQQQDRLEAADVVVVDAAERLAVSSGARLLEQLAEGSLRRLVLLGDPDELDGPAPGRLLGDMVESAVVPVCSIADVRQTAPLQMLGESLRAGRLSALDPAERSVVVTPAADPAQALTRAAQLVTTSVPRVFGVAPEQTRVATLRTGGVCGVNALRAAVDVDLRVGTLDDVSGEACEALVLVLPAESAGSLTRAALLSAAACATQHLSIVHQVGPALAAAVALRPRRQRRTRLATLLTETLG